MVDPERSFVPAAGHDWLLPLYDPLLRFLAGERASKQALIEQSGLRPGHRVLDLGCGTGTLAVWLTQREPEAEVCAVDPDPKALAIARRKARRAGAEVHYQQSFGDGLPYPDAHFDRVLSSFVFHHLDTEEKRATLREVRRVLAPGGSFHLLDFGPARDGRRGLLARLLHHDERLHDNLTGRIPALLADAGFPVAEQVADRPGLFGNAAYFRATSPQR